MFFINHCFFFFFSYYDADICRGVWAQNKHDKLSTSSYNKLALVIINQLWCLTCSTQMEVRKLSSAKMCVKLFNYGKRKYYFFSLKHTLDSLTDPSFSCFSSSSHKVWRTKTLTFIACTGMFFFPQENRLFWNASICVMSIAIQLCSPQSNAAILVRNPPFSCTM